MSGKQEQIKKIAEKLSKVPWNNPKIVKDLEWILKYVDMLEEVDTTWVKPTISVVEVWTPLREDVVVDKIVNPSELLSCSPQKVVSDQIVLPNIMK